MCNGLLALPCSLPEQHVSTGQTCIRKFMHLTSGHRVQLCNQSQGICRYVVPRLVQRWQPLLWRCRYENRLADSGTKQDFDLLS